ncbi:FMN-dependent alpha-hydroxy acid dehydrogenase [Haladaptatus paucihalophilus DX253]|uniref:FMN-dependent alpha-hydroxy acid dehydrogenase n=1 Tax=Haladaptatus paucihalophilus DX253 TaxID=797209 RepID=E7QRP6_HALPU|nr:alpha-hydroxy-acid oxidizing protein [Haladaptatus paucihalophilus]EFW92665.1 FMN-dependent alpha-hydroxy acid dehydrogenase [Haladaptatus paucihalophilus DX253]SHK16366.1 FMN-dependent dehydrogenase, includes L-lactate dehydrogenase and type II isopentenyl diphosphate isomerase [Haladaptatus paucihalophilus DX253]
MNDPSKPFGPNRQREVYAGGMLADQTPDLPTSPDELADLAREHLPPEAHAYVAGSAGSESTKGENRRAFDRWRIVPRMLRDVSERDLSVEILGQTLPVPVMLAPVGVQSIIHEEGELATARTAADLDVPLVLSSASSETMEDVAEALGDTLGWFQLYWSADRDVTASFVSRAEDAGYEAIVVTLDTPMMGWRERDVDHAYLPFLDGEGVANYLSDPAFRDALDAPPEEDMSSALWRFTETFGDPSLSWDDLDFLREHTDLPILLKGILHPDDAREAVERGVDGLVVSNHGGRQVDGAIGALDALPDVVDAVGDDVPVLFDSGVRRGADAFRAVALGADAVLLGRPYIYGLAIAGREGVRGVLRNFLADLDLTLALSGHTSFEDVTRATLRETGD